MKVFINQQCNNNIFASKCNPLHRVEALKART